MLINYLRILMLCCIDLEEKQEGVSANLSQDEKERFLKLMEEAAEESNKETDSVTEVGQR